MKYVDNQHLIKAEKRSFGGVIHGSNPRAVTSHDPGDYEVDHLIPLELGGSNSIKNLWPEIPPNVALGTPK